MLHYILLIISTLMVAACLPEKRESEPVDDTAAVKKWINELESNEEARLQAEKQRAFEEATYSDECIKHFMRPEIWDEYKFVFIGQINEIIKESVITTSQPYLYSPERRNKQNNYFRISIEVIDDIKENIDDDAEIKEKRASQTIFPKWPKNGIFLTTNHNFNNIKEHSEYLFFLKRLKRYNPQTIKLDENCNGVFNFNTELAKTLIKSFKERK